MVLHHGLKSQHSTIYSYYTIETLKKDSLSKIRRLSDKDFATCLRYKMLRLRMKRAYSCGTQPIPNVDSNAVDKQLC